MGVNSYSISTNTEKIDIKNAPNCKCGNKFIFEQHWHKRKKTNEGIVAKCNKCGELFYSYNEKSIIDKINYYYIKIRKDKIKKLLNE